MGNFSAREWGGDPTAEYVKSTTYIRAGRHNWFETLMRNKQFVALATQMYVSTFAGHIDTTLAEIDTLKTQIDASARLNFLKWDGNRLLGDHLRHGPDRDFFSDLSNRRQAQHRPTLGILEQVTGQIRWIRPRIQDV